MHHTQVWLQTSDVSVHVCDGHPAAHEQAAGQVRGLAWVHLHELVLAREDLCEDLPNHAHMIVMIIKVIRVNINDKTNDDNDKNDDNDNDKNANIVRQDQKPFSSSSSSINCMSALC